ncbi:MAG: hypothetical protein HQ539_00320 [Parcubacteria group bacterium]|nr:hypothetical protein [Parcubacteria group bacterium]
MWMIVMAPVYIFCFIVALLMCFFTPPNTKKDCINFFVLGGCLFLTSFVISIVFAIGYVLGHGRYPFLEVMMFIMELSGMFYFISAWLNWPNDGVVNNVM